VRARRASPGSVMLEVLIALGVFIGAAITIASLVGQTMSDLRSVKDTERAADLARSAMALIEAGAATPATLNGPVGAGGLVAAVSVEGTGAAFDDAPPAPTGWELEIQTEASPFEGLTKVAVTAVRVGNGGGAGGGASYTLRQLVRLGGKGEETVGAEDRISEEARRGVRERREPSAFGKGAGR
jgi:hypothetical protein